VGGPNLVWVKPAQHALAPDAAPLRFAAQVKRKPLARPCKNEGHKNQQDE
jgi:hypothetical protein